MPDKISVEPTFHDMLAHIINIRVNGTSNHEEQILDLIEAILNRLILLEVEK